MKETKKELNEITGSSRLFHEASCEMRDMDIYRKGMLTDIQRFSLHDGPGIRTTVFLKGCNMSCAWCHNPETIQAKPQLLYYENNCIGCMKCIEVCPIQAHKNIQALHLFEREQCTECGKCAKICYPGALVMAGRKMDLQSIMTEILQDLTYYKNSGGGVTLSGGEVMVQSEFALEILKLCREKGIATAIETNMHTPWEILKNLLEFTDLMMLDIKIMNREKHEKWTGASNQLILENIVRLSEEGIPMIIRTPVIPGVNDTPEDIQAISRFVASLSNVKYYELLNYNPLGESKYRGLGIKNPLEQAHPLPDAQMKLLADAARVFCTNVRIG